MKKQEEELKLLEKLLAIKTTNTNKPINEV